MPVSRALRADSSRTSRAAAGWANKGKPSDESASVKRAKRANFPRRFNWLRPRVLLESRNDFLARLVEKADTDIVNDERMRWVASQRVLGLAENDLVIDATGLGKDGRAFSFLAVGDPGEADISQYIVVPHLLAQKDTSFIVIVSDVIYPTGESNDYADAFYRAYQEYEGPIYALPGNHDWYSLLTGFMWNICGAEPLPEPTERLASYSWQERLARFLWLRPRTPERELLMAYRYERWQKGFGEGDLAAPRQRTPYFAIDTGSLLLVCIDTGTSGTIDREQGAWLCRMASRNGPKILFTGNPLWVNAKEHECKIKWLPRFSDDRHPERTDDPRPSWTRDEPDRPCDFDTVNAIVREPSHKFIAAIGGDIHNYQRYPIGDIQYIVSGGGGAFMSPTHTIKNLDETQGNPIAEEALRLYPLRGDSLARFALGSGKRLRLTVGGAVLLSLTLWFIALQVWNPHNAKMRDWFVVFEPLRWLIEKLNVSPGTEEFGISPLSWVPEADYGDWAAVAFGAVLLAIGVSLLLLPWFNWRVKTVFALVAAGAALLAWHTVLFDLPGGKITYLVVGIVGSLAIPLLSLQWARELRLLVRAAFVAILLVAAVIFADWELIEDDRWVAVPELLTLSAIAFVLVGGPRLKPWPSVYAAAAICALVLVLFWVPIGWSSFPIVLVATVVSGVTLSSAILLFPILFRGDEVDPDKAAKYLSREATPVRPSAAAVEVDAAAKRRLGGLKNFFFYLSETVYAALLDNNNQPFFKNFLRVDVDGGQVKIYCFGVVEELKRRPGERVHSTVEDHVHWDGSRWTEARAILGEGGTTPVKGEVDWYPGADLRFHLDAEEGAEFTVLFSDDDGWSDMGPPLTYRGLGTPWTPASPGSPRPRGIALRRAGDGPDQPADAEGTFV